jgi:hypothetical protein
VSEKPTLNELISMNDEIQSLLSDGAERLGFAKNSPEMAEAVAHLLSLVCEHLGLVRVCLMDLIKEANDEHYGG